MTLTPEKLDELERLAELAHGGPRAVTYDRDGNAYEVVFAKAQHRRLFLMPSDGGTKTEADAELCASLDPATVRELVRLARIGERHETRPDPLGDAMNSGDGVYRP